MPTVDENYRAKLAARARGTTKVTVHPVQFENLPAQDRYQAKLARHAERMAAGAGQTADSAALSEILDICVKLGMEPSEIELFKEHAARMSEDELEDNLRQARRDLRRKADGEAKAKAEAEKAEAEASREAKKKADGEAKAKAEAEKPKG